MPDSSIRGQARPILEGLVNRGYSTTRIQRLLQETGLGYRRTSLLSDIAEIRGIEQKGRVFSAVPLGKLPTARSIGVTSKHLSSPFMYTARIGYYDVTTDKTTYRWRSMTVNKVRTRGALRNRLVELAGEDAGNYGTEVVGVDLEKLDMRDTAEYAWEPDDSPW